MVGSGAAVPQRPSARSPRSSGKGPLLRSTRRSASSDGASGRCGRRLRGTRCPTRLRWPLTDDAAQHRGTVPRGRGRLSWPPGCRLRGARSFGLSTCARPAENSAEGRPRLLLLTRRWTNRRALVSPRHPWPLNLYVQPTGGDHGGCIEQALRRSSRGAVPQRRVRRGSADARTGHGVDPQGRPNPPRSPWLHRRRGGGRAHEKPVQPHLLDAIFSVP
jgi:hypothetical protein